MLFYFSSLALLPYRQYLLYV